MAFGYEPIAQSTWAFMSSLLMLALFFKFNRFWSVRNLDLVLLILLAPGLLLVHNGSHLRTEAARQHAAAPANPPSASTDGNASRSSQSADQAQPPLDESAESAADPAADAAAQDTLPADNGAVSDAPGEENAELSPAEIEARAIERRGYLLLMLVALVWLVRLLFDPLLRRKPMLEPNLNTSGLVFLACSFMIFLFANVVISQPVPRDVQSAQAAVELVHGSPEADGGVLRRHGPGYVMLFVLPVMPTFVGDGEDREPVTLSEEERQLELAAKILAVLGQIAIVAGLVYVGRRHFNSFSTGVGMATVYLMLPYTWQRTGDVLHILPSALLVWSIAMYRRPIASGVFVGLAAGVSYYPLFLLPLWLSFYWDRGRWRFLGAMLTSLGLVIGSLALTTTSAADFWYQLSSMLGIFLPHIEGLEGIWALGWEPWFRLPLMVAFIALCITFAAWPQEKNLGTLMALVAAAMVALQFWHGFGGGLYIAWYVPFALMTFFRPNLDDRIATNAVRAVG